MKRARWTTSGILLTVLIICAGAIAGEKGVRMKTLELKTEITEGKDKQVDVLFEGPRRKIVQITLRNNGVLESHKAVEPITIQCVTGKGTLTVGRGLPTGRVIDDSSSEEKKSLELVPGVLVTIEPNTVHEIHGQPAVSILLSKFADK